MGTPARIAARGTDGQLRTTRINYDGDPESMLTVLGLIAQRDGYATMATTLTDSPEWRDLDPTALIPTERDDLHTVTGYGNAYNEPTTPASDRVYDEPFAYFIHQITGQISVKVGREDPYFWTVGDPIPQRVR